MKAKRILFRADGNAKTGLGHLYRVFALIEMLKEDYEYYLITRADSELVVIPAGYKTDIIPKNICHAEESEWLLTRYDPKTHILIADGYAYDSKYQKEIKKAGFKLVYIDDLTTTKMFADVVVNHSLIVVPQAFETQEHTKFALGTNYAMLRPSFIEAAKKEKKADSIKEVFVSFGGADFYDLTSKTVSALINIKSINKIHVLIGAANNHQIIYKIEEENNNVIIYNNLPEKEILDVMQRCQLAIIPSSTISYEVCSVKMLVICGYYVDNQELIYKGLKEKNIIIPAGDFRLYNVRSFERIIKKALELDISNHDNMLKKQKALFDGNQKERFLNIIKSFN